MANKKLEPLFWINPNFRLQFPYFSIKWYKIDHQVLLQEALQEGMEKMVYQTKKNLMMIVLRSDHSGLDGKDHKESASEFFFGDNAAANQELYLSLWRTIADRYEGNATVAGYDLLNEPYCTYRYNSSKSADELHTILWDVYDRAYNVIRQEDADHVIIMEATWNPEDLPNPEAYGWENVMYEYHNYLYDDYDNVGGGQISNMENKTNAIGNADYNVPSYMGEFNYFNNYGAWDDGLALLTELGINWTSWTYKTITGYGNWGLYHHPEYMDNGLDISTASFDARA